MREFFAEIQISEEQAGALAQGLWAVALADGQVHPREEMLISELYGSITESANPLGSLSRGAPLGAEVLAVALPTTPLRGLFIKTAILLAYADGTFSEAEKKEVDKFAGAMGVSSASVLEMEQEVKDFLMTHLSHLNNLDAAVEVAKELDL